MGAPIVHFEIGCQDKDKTVSFFEKLFGWQMQSYGDTTAMVNTGSESGIHGHISALGHEPHQYTTFYAQVDDIEATLKKAEELGGRTIIPKTEVPTMGHFAWFSDPGGNTIGLWKPMGG